MIVIGRRIMIYKFGNWRPSKIPVDDVFRASLILFEMGALEPQSQVLGGVGKCNDFFFRVCKTKIYVSLLEYLLRSIFKSPGIIDLEGLSLQHVWNLSPSVAKKIISLMVVSKIVFFMQRKIAKILTIFNGLSSIVITFRLVCQFEPPQFTLSTTIGPLTWHGRFSSHSSVIECANRFSFMVQTWNHSINTLTENICPQNMAVKCRNSHIPLGWRI